MSILISILIFGLIVVIHEFGHFIAAKKSGVAVLEFAIGMGPKFWQYQGKDTLYTLRLFPIGGFCKMQEDDEAGSYNSVSTIKKIAIVLAGPFMNFILAFLVFVILAMFSISSFTVIENVFSGTPAEKAGLIEGDKIVGINGSKVRIRDDMDFALAAYSGGSVEIVAIRENGEKIVRQIEPIKKEGRYIIGVGLHAKAPILGSNEDNLQKMNVWDCLYVGFWRMIYMIKVTIIGFSKLITMQIPFNGVAGPIGLTTVIGDVYQQTISKSVIEMVFRMMTILGLLSANIGVMNLFPIPALDGGRFIFLVIELFRGRAIDPEKEGMVHLVGFALLMFLGIVVAFHDISKFF